jgi:imidazoleglycerol-phosphate dehydratase/histidinol-phosphatase
MSGARVLFIDRDGTLVEEPPDEQVDSLQKIKLLPGVIPALLELKRAGYRLVLVSNQDGLGTESFPTPTFEEAQDFLRSLLASQGIEFEAEFFCPHRPQDGCECRKPKTGLLLSYLRENPLDLRDSYVIGDRETDLQLATNLGLTGLRVRIGDSSPGQPSLSICRRDRTRACDARRNGHSSGQSRSLVPVSIKTGIGFTTTCSSRSRGGGLRSN